MPERRFDCRCGMIADRLSIWFDDDLYGLPSAQQDFEVTIGTPGQAMMIDRLREALNVLFGKRAVYGSVLLNREDAKEIRRFMTEYLDRMDR